VQHWHAGAIYGIAELLHQFKIFMTCSKSPLIVIFFIFFCANAYKKNQTLSIAAEKDSVQYFSEVAQFIQQVEQQELNDRYFILEDEPANLDWPDSLCLAQLKADTATFSEIELSFIENQKKNPLLRLWTNELIPKIKIISSDTVRKIFNDNSKSWPFFYKHIGHSVSSFSAPIFLRNFSYCLFYSDNSCGDLCGEGNFSLYKKVNNKWTAVRIYCSWIS